MTQIPEEYISAYLDNQTLSDTERRAVEQHLHHNPAFQAEYQSLHLLKRHLAARQDALRMKAPSEARNGVVSIIHQETERQQILMSTGKRHDDLRILKNDKKMQTVESPTTLPHIHHSSVPIRAWLDTILHLAPERIILAAAMIGFSVLGFWAVRSALLSEQLLESSSAYYANAVMHKPHLRRNISIPAQQGNNTPQPPNFCLESVHNFEAVADGKITLQYKTHSFRQLEKFFYQHGITYRIVRPKFPAELLGGVISEEHGVKSAHLVFHHGADMLYMWQVKHTELAVHHHLPEKIHTMLHKGEWYWDTTTAPETTVAVWEDKHTMCSMVSHLKPQTMAALFH